MAPAPRRGRTPRPALLCLATLLLTSFCARSAAAQALGFEPAEQALREVEDLATERVLPGAQAVARFLESRADHVQVELAAAALRGAPLAAALISDAALRASEARPVAPEQRAAAAAAVAPPRRAALLVRGVPGGVALAVPPPFAAPHALLQAFAREAAFMMAALEAQGAALERQAAAAAAAGSPLPRRLCPHRAAAAARDEALRGPLPPGAHRKVSVTVGPGFQMIAVHSVLDGRAQPGAAQRSLPPPQGEGPAPEQARQAPRLADAALLLALAAACAATFAAFMRALLQLRAALAAAGAAAAGDADSDDGEGRYVSLGSEEEEAGPGAESEADEEAEGKARAYRAGRSFLGRRAGSEAELDRPLLLSAADAAGARELAGARVAVVLPGGAWERAEYRNAAFGGARRA